MVKLCVELTSDVYKKLLAIAIANKESISATASRLMHTAIAEAKPKRIKVNKYPRNENSKPKY